MGGWSKEKKYFLGSTVGHSLEDITMDMPNMSVREVTVMTGSKHRRRPLDRWKISVWKASPSRYGIINDRKYPYLYLVSKFLGKQRPGIWDLWLPRWGRVKLIC